MISFAGARGTRKERTLERTQIIDDLDETSLASRVHFALDGADLEIDLSPEHESDLRGLLSTYVAAARKAAGLPARKPKPKHAQTATAPSGVLPVNSNGTRGTYPTQAVRAWAQEAGITHKGKPVSGHGRIPAEVYDQYHAMVTSP